MNDCVIPLNNEQLSVLPQDSCTNTNPVRFMCRRKSVNICTGQLVGGNVIYQTVYWDRPKEFVDAVLEFLQDNNPDETFTVIYSE